MTLRCKPGCLAIINRALIPENVGRVVTCVRYDGSVTVYGLGGDPFVQPRSWAITGAVQSTGLPGKTVYACDDNLTPISDPDADVGTDVPATNELESTPA